MNDECFNGEELTKITNSHKYISFYEDINKNPNYYFDKVLEASLSTNICEQLNMSFTDLLNLDWATFQKIRDKIIKIEDNKSKHLQELAAKNTK